MGNTPLWGVAHAVGGWGALGLRTSPTRQVGWDPAWWMGEVRKPSAPHPPTAWATPHSGVLPTPQVGRDQLPLSHKPTASVREPLPSMTEATSMVMTTRAPETDCPDLARPPHNTRCLLTGRRNACLGASRPKTEPAYVLVYSC